MEATFRAVIIVVLRLLFVVMIPRSYAAVPWAGFSKRAAPRARRPALLARSHGSELDAVGRHDRAIPFPICARRLPDDLPESPAKCPEAGEADVKADVGHGAAGLAQQEHRTLDPASLQVAMGRLAEDGAEAAAEVGGRRCGPPPPQRARRAARRRRGPSRRGRAAGAG